MLRPSRENESGHPPMSNKHACSVQAYSSCNPTRDGLEQPRLPYTHDSGIPTNSYGHSVWFRDRLAIDIHPFYAMVDQISVAGWLSSARILPRPPSGQGCNFWNSTPPFFLEPMVLASMCSAGIGVRPMSSVEAPAYDPANTVMREPVWNSPVGAPASDEMTKSAAH